MHAFIKYIHETNKVNSINSMVTHPRRYLPIPQAIWIARLSTRKHAGFNDTFTRICVLMKTVNLRFVIKLTLSSYIFHNEYVN